jgi:hypothetical protein
MGGQSFFFGGIHVVLSSSLVAHNWGSRCFRCARTETLRLEWSIVIGVNKVRPQRPFGIHARNLFGCRMSLTPSRKALAAGTALFAAKGVYSRVSTGGCRSVRFRDFPTGR